MSPRENSVNLNNHFNFRINDDDRRAINRIATHMQRKPGDAVRLILRKCAEQIEAADRTTQASTKQGRQARHVRD